MNPNLRSTISIILSRAEMESSDDGPIFTRRPDAPQRDPHEALVPATKMHNEITVIDHALTRPWTVTRTYVKSAESKPQWPEFICAEGNSHVFIGKENYCISGDGLLMPDRKGQEAPDSRYFAPGKK